MAVGSFLFDVHVMATYIGPKNLRLKLCFGNIAYNFYIEIIVIIIKKFFLGTSLLSQSWHSIFIKFVILLLIIKTKGVGQCALWRRIKSKFATNPGSDHRSTHYGHFSSVMVMMALISFDSQYRDLNLNITRPGSSSWIVLIFHHCHPPSFHLILTASQVASPQTITKSTSNDQYGTEHKPRPTGDS